MPVPIAAASSNGNPCHIGHRRIRLAAALVSSVGTGAPHAPIEESSSRGLRGMDLSERPAPALLRSFVRSGQASGDCVDNADWSYTEDGERTTCANLGPQWREFCTQFGLVSEEVAENCPRTCRHCSEPSEPGPSPASPGIPSGDACVDDPTWTDAAFGGDGSTTCRSLAETSWNIRRGFCNFEEDASVASQVQAACPVTCRACQPDGDDTPADPSGCADDPHWSDSVYGDGTFQCVDAVDEFSVQACADAGPEAREFRRGCPRTCNACEEAVTLNQCFDDPDWTDAQVGGDGSSTCRDLANQWDRLCFFEEEDAQGQPLGPQVRRACPFTCGTCEEAVVQRNGTSGTDKEVIPLNCSVWDRRTIEVEHECVSINPFRNYLVIPAYVLALCVCLCCIGVPMICSRMAERSRASGIGEMSESRRFGRPRSGESRLSSATSASVKTSSGSGTSRSDRSDRSDRRSRARSRRVQSDVFGDIEGKSSVRFAERTHQAHGTTQGRSHRSQVEGLELTTVVTSASLDHLLDERLIATGYCYAGAIAKGTSGVMMAAAFSGTKGWECVYKKPHSEDGVRVDETKSLLSTVTSGQPPETGLWLGGTRYNLEDSNFQFQYAPGIIFPIWYGRATKHVKAAWITLPQSVHIVRVVTGSQSFIVCGFCEEAEGPQGDPNCKLPRHWPPPPTLKCQGVLHLAAHLQASFGV